MGEKVRKLKGDEYGFYCPGCETWHRIDGGAGGWYFNGDYERPTFIPDLLNATTELDRVPHRCHLSIVKGRIRYYDDCSHEFAERYISMEDVEDV